MLSVIIPAYNVEKYIRRCIESVLNQELKNIEIIVIDDGSTDKTSEICKSLAKENQNITYKKIKNSGCSNARNTGLIFSKGEFIAFLDSDDWVDKNMYKHMLEKALKDDADIVICGYKKVNEDNKFLSEVRIEEGLTKKEYIDCKTEWFCSPCNKIYKRDILIKNKITFLSDAYIGEDMLFNFKASHYAKKIIAIDKSFYTYYMNLSSISNNYKNRLDIYIVIGELIKFYKTNGTYIENKKNIEDCFKYHGIKYPFDVIQKLKEERVENWRSFYKKVKMEIQKFKIQRTLNINIYYFYRIFRLKFILLKKYKKIFIKK